MSAKFWQNKRVLITGHTGFKGAWLTLWLRQLGADVLGVALEPEFRPGLLDQFRMIGEIQHCIQDIRDATGLRLVVENFDPEIVFHLAAQPLVRRSYQDPQATWSTNVFGSINLMQAMRDLQSPTVAVMVTTDKVYQNKEWVHGYREVDPLGGHDPYSSSKAAMEIAVESWRKSFFGDSRHIAIATARAGNVIGGGDFSDDRIIPDLVRSLINGTPATVRNPQATRPWQHVLEPLSGYMKLAERLFDAQSSGDSEQLQLLASSWNFGPLPEANRTVEELVTTAFQTWPGTWHDQSDSNGPHEATFLGLAIDKATRYLNWSPRWSFDQAVHATVNWYRKQILDNACPRALAENQIATFTGAAATLARRAA
ncbi:MAG: CDP-glucose 4,6-dehydratase [Planctomycetaceae bacterium]